MSTRIYVPDKMVLEDGHAIVNISSRLAIWESAHHTPFVSNFFGNLSADPHFCQSIPRGQGSACQQAIVGLMRAQLYQQLLQIGWFSRYNTFGKFCPAARLHSMTLACPRNTKGGALSGLSLGHIPACRTGIGGDRSIQDYFPDKEVVLTYRRSVHSACVQLSRASCLLGPGSFQSPAPSAAPLPESLQSHPPGTRWPGPLLSENSSGKGTCNMDRTMSLGFA